MTVAIGSGTLATQSVSLPSRKSALRRDGAFRNGHNRIRGVCNAMSAGILTSCTLGIFDLGCPLGAWRRLNYPIALYLDLNLVPSQNDRKDRSPPK